MKQSIDILQGYFTCDDEAIRNKYYNLLDSFWHYSQGDVLKKITETDEAIRLDFTSGKNVSIPKPQELQSVEISFVNGLQEALNSKVAKTPGKDLSANDFTDELLQKLEGLQNYVHPEQHQINEVNGLQEALNDRVLKEEGRDLSSNDFTDEYKQKLDNPNIPNLEKVTTSGNATKLGTPEAPPLLIPEGELTTTPVNGAIEHDEDNIYIVHNGVRYPILKRYIHKETNYNGALNVYVRTTNEAGDIITSPMSYSFYKGMPFKTTSSVSAKFTFSTDKIYNDYVNSREISLQVKSDVAAFGWKTLSTIGFNDDLEIRVPKLEILSFDIEMLYIPVGNSRHIRFKAFPQSYNTLSDITVATKYITSPGFATSRNDLELEFRLVYTCVVTEKPPGTRQIALIDKRTINIKEL
ncbi:hypothetical protein GGR32_000127 [Mesonia hippocampi]|uniref:Uncharacterized protein n=2 Tax=Mesonia hippocampi TaxID=1628250 RepID=A0A840EL58_9FLAO|nr:hypothetical protein [Mesonia hippocampi]